MGTEREREEYKNNRDIRLLPVLGKMQGLLVGEERRGEKEG